MRGRINKKPKVNKWKEKAKARREEIWRQRKRIEELKASRLRWKKKYQEEKAHVKRLSKLSQAGIEGEPINKTAKVKLHHYRLGQITLCMQLRQGAGVSLRGCIKIIKVLHVILGLELFEPSINSIRNWEQKLGYYQILKPEEEGGEWVLILDESVMVGQQKILLLLGISLKKYKFEKALDFEQIEVVGLRVGKSCKAEDVQEEISKVQRRGYRFKYAVSDNGENLRKALRLSQLLHVEDCTHAIGLLIEKRYKKDKTFQSFSKRSALFKRQISMSKHAVMMPPVQRSKGRFLNLTSISNWSNKLLGLTEIYKDEAEKEEAYNRIKWIKEYEVLIKDMVVHHQLMNEVLKVLKTEGLSKRTQKKCLQIMDKSLSDQSFKSAISQYLSRNTKSLKKEEKRICTSDIIESMFGRYKNKRSSNKNVGFTTNCLTIANTVSSTKSSSIKQALETVKIKDINDWSTQNLTPSILKQKKELFKNVG